MSIGFKACADLFISDGSGFLYLYACCNLNLLEIRDTAWNTVDGEIWISRDSLPEPEVHEKIRRLPSGRKKLIVKRIPRWPLVTELIAEGKITVRNASGTWQTRDSVDMMAIRLINSILMDYQVKGPCRSMFLWISASFWPPIISTSWNLLAQGILTMPFSENTWSV